MKSGFLDKLIDRMDRLDPKSLQTQFLRLAHEKGLLETIFQSIQEGVVVIDGAGRLTYANRAAEQLMGFSFERVESRPVSNYIRGIDWDRILSLDDSEWSKLLTQEIELSYPEHRFVNFYVVPLAIDDRREKGAVVILRDVTSDRQQEASMIETERLNSVKLLAAGVAHEIGNPLNALTIHLQLLEREIGKLRGKERDDLKDLVKIARDEVSRLDLITSQFLRAVRPAKPKLVLSRVDALMKETLNLLGREIQNRNIQVELKCASSLPRIRMDRNQMKQAFVNILRNAYQAMPDGGKIVVAISSTERHLAISFSDTGVGIKPEDFGRIFDPYFTTRPEGSGLGLMIVQRIIQEHGGQIEIVSKPKAGTSFTIILPQAERRMKLLPRSTEYVQ
ncbi:MAG: PAS domain-containing sensor histidine kinase [Verrucomicrobia bacterium]|nr:PAS domain-containing sensor histidine kinase [Verrucomicrobiota bacterium]